MAKRNKIIQEKPLDINPDFGQQRVIRSVDKKMVGMVIESFDHMSITVQ